MKVSELCPFCGRITSQELNVTAEQLRRYRNHEDLIQNIFSKLNAAEREFIMSGYCYECQEMIFAEPDDEDEEV